MHCFKGLRRKQSSSASSQRLEKEQEDGNCRNPIHYLNKIRTTSTEQEGNYLKNGSAVLEQFLALCNGNYRIPIRYFSAAEINKAISHCENKIAVDIYCYMFTGSLDKCLVLIRLVPDFALTHMICRDIAITAQMSHLKNVLKLIGCCLEFEHPALVYEYIGPITLDELLFGNIHGQSLSWGSRLRIAKEIASAVVFLHSEFKTPIIHKNLKPSNVIVDKNSGVAKLFDFSFSVSLPPGELQLQEDDTTGTIGYIDPEYLSSRIVTQKADVFSFGVILLELLTRKSVWDISDEFSGLDCTIEECNVVDIVDPAILEEHGIGILQQLEDWFDLVRKCRSLNGEDRPDMIDVARELR